MNKKILKEQKELNGKDMELIIYDDAYDFIKYNWNSVAFAEKHIFAEGIIEEDDFILTVNGFVKITNNLTGEIYYNLNTETVRELMLSGDLYNENLYTINSSNWFEIIRYSGGWRVSSHHYYYKPTTINELKINFTAFVKDIFERRI